MTKAVLSAGGSPPDRLPPPASIDVQCEMTHQDHEQAVPDWQKLLPNTAIHTHIPRALAAVRIKHRCSKMFPVSICANCLVGTFGKPLRWIGHLLNAHCHTERGNRSRNPL